MATKANIKPIILLLVNSTSKYIILGNKSINIDIILTNENSVNISPF